MNWREQYLRAARIFMSNPLCFIATNFLSNIISDADIIVKEKQGNSWVINRNNTLDTWLEKPNPQMDKMEFLKAITLHELVFGKAQCVMFNKGEILPDGDTALENNIFDVVYPIRILKDTAQLNSRKYYYFPMRHQKYWEIPSSKVYVSVSYNPIAHETGIALPNNPLERTFRIHELYIQMLDNMFQRGGIPQYLLRRLVDITKDPTAYGVTDDMIEEQVQKIYAQIGNTGTMPNAILGLYGNWEMTRIGTPFNEIMNTDIMDWVESTVSGVYGIPASLLQVGMKNSNQRASRQQDSIDFYNNVVHRMLKRITRSLGQFLIPKFFDSKWKERFMLDFDVSSMPLAQYVRAKDNREVERHFTSRILNLGQTWEKLEYDVSELTEEQRMMYYDGSVNNFSIGTGDQSIESGNGLE